MQENGTMEKSTETSTDSLTLADMDGAIIAVRDIEAKYKEAKGVSDDLYQQLTDAKAKVISMLEESDRTVYIAEGVGRVKITHEMSVQTPKTVEDKKKFFAWLAKVKGQTIADNYLTINSQSLNSLYNELTEEAALRGEILMPEGLGEPIARVKLSLTKA